MTISEIEQYHPTPTTPSDSVRAISYGAMLCELLERFSDYRPQEAAPDAAPETAHISEAQMLSALSTMIPHTGEESEIHLCCSVQTYSASTIAHAIEDVDATLLSLLAYPTRPGLLDVYLRINQADPSRAARSLERYGLTVSDARGTYDADVEAGMQRLDELQHFLNI